MPDFPLILVRGLLAAFLLLPLSATLQAQSAPPSSAASGNTRTTSATWWK